YTTSDAKPAVAKAIRETAAQRDRLQDKQEDAGAASWRERTLNAEHALKTANHEIIAQRTRIGQLLGRIRDLEAEWTQDAIQRVTTENTTLKQRVRQLTADNRTLDERLRPPAPASASKTAASPTSKPVSPTRDQRRDPLPLTNYDEDRETTVPIDNPVDRG